MMKYKGYTAKTEIDDERGIIHGEVLGIVDVVTFQGENVEELRKAFHDSVDDYLEFCEERGESPEKPYSGKFVLRVSPELHREITHAAEESGQSLNQWVVSCLGVRVGKTTTF